MNTRAPSFGLGLFPLPEAARLAQLDVRAARRWAEGYKFIYKGEKRFSRGVMSRVLEPVQGQRDLTCSEMLTLGLVKAFKGQGWCYPLSKRSQNVLRPISARLCHSFPSAFAATAARSSSSSNEIRFLPTTNHCLRRLSESWIFPVIRNFPFRVVNENNHLIRCFEDDLDIDTFTMPMSVYRAICRRINCWGGQHTSGQSCEGLGCKCDGVWTRWRRTISVPPLAQSYQHSQTVPGALPSSLIRPTSRD